jgi:hypothetical protein
MCSTTNVWPAAIDSVVLWCDDIFDYRGKVSMNDKGKETVDMKIEFKLGRSKEQNLKSLERIAVGLKEKVGIV